MKLSLVFLLGVARERHVLAFICQNNVILGVLLVYYTTTIRYFIVGYHIYYFFN